MRAKPLFASLLLCVACGQVAEPPRRDVAGASPPETARATPSGLEPEGEASQPAEVPFKDGDRAFAAVKESLRRRYAGGTVTEDELYRAAVRGMLEHIDPRRAAYNKLLSPGELAALHDDLRGEIVGIGASVKFDDGSGYTDVLAVFPSSPAEKAGLRAGDKILNVNGRLYKGKTSRDVLADIRGKAGEPVSLAVLRGDKVETVRVVRGVVVYDVVQAILLPGDVGYLRIRAFNAKTRPALDKGLAELEAKGTKRLVIDLRGNPGGSFEDAIDCAEALLPNGAPIVRLEKAGESQTLTSKGTPRLAGAPVAVLVDAETASGGEFLAAALQEERRAALVGAKTFGKWSVQTIDDLPNGYAVKYTISEMKPPSGKSLDGIGLAPDVEVSADPKAIAVAMMESDPIKRLAADNPLRTAAAVVGSKPAARTP